jgi:hypothetical protein
MYAIVNISQGCELMSLKKAHYADSKQELSSITSLLREGNYMNRLLRCNCATRIQVFPKALNFLLALFRCDTFFKFGRDELIKESYLLPRIRTLRSLRNKVDHYEIPLMTRGFELRRNSIPFQD